MHLIGKVVTWVLIIVFLMVLGGKAAEGRQFGNNAAKALGVVATVAIDGTFIIVNALTNIGSGSSKKGDKKAPATKSSQPA